MHSLNLLSLSLLVVQAMQPVLVSAAPVSSEKPSNYVELPEGYNLPTWDSPGYENNFIAQLCSNKDIIDEFKPAKDRWKAAVADNCLGYFDIVGQMFPERIFNKDFSYVQAFSRFFNGPENWTCDMKENPCGSGVATCGDGSMDPFSRPIANPAAWMIMLAPFHAPYPVRS